MGCKVGVNLLNTVLSLKKIPAQFNHTFAALHYRNYRLWFIGQTISLFGTWMQNTAQGYLVYEITGSAAYLGYVGFAAGVPSLLLFNLFGGAIADRFSRRLMLVITQTAMMILAFILAGLVFSGLVQPWHIIVLAFFLGVANAFDAPARLAFVTEMVERKDLTNAIALNATMFNIGTVLGPVIAGITYALVGPAWCFTVNGISYLAVIVALLLMKFEPQIKTLHQKSVIFEIVEGFRYTINEKIVRVMIIDLVVLSLFGISLLTLLPAWSVEILGGDVRTNGLLMSARGAGALTAALMLAALAHRNIGGKLWTAGSLLMPIALLLFSRVAWLPVSMILLAGMGWSFITQVNSANALIQNRISDEMRGRVMGIYTLTFFGSMPIGSLLAGQLATRLGLPTTVALGSIICLITAVYIYVRIPSIRKLH
jgi:MFS family permease